MLAMGSSACDTDGPEEVNCDFDLQAMRTNYADELIVPKLEQWYTSTQLLAAMAAQYAGAPSEPNLVELRIMWYASYRSYQAVCAFGFGPGIINGLAFREYVNTFPTNIALIDDYLTSGAVDADSNPNSTVGYPALEYLIFGPIGTSQADVVAAYTSGADSASRAAYVVSLANRINTIAQQQVDGWETYKSTFINSTGAAEGSTLSLLVNELNYDMEILKSFKFKIPLGKFNGGVALPNQVEGYYSGATASLAVDQFNSIRAIYFGVGLDNSDGLGLHDYLLCLKAGQDADGFLADAIADKFQDMEDAMLLLQDPMAEQLVADKPTVDAAYLQMQMMTPLLKREMASALGVQISYQDNDGD